MRQINLVEGKVVAPEGMKVGIVAARFNEIIVNKLLGGAVDGLVRHGVEEENITAHGYREHLRFRLQHRRWHSQENMMQLSALELSSVEILHIMIWCVMNLPREIAQVELATGIPVLFGVITTENIEQAIARAGSKAGNKGYDCALSAIEMVNLMKQL